MNKKDKPTTFKKVSMFVIALVCGFFSYVYWTSPTAIQASELVVLLINAIGIGLTVAAVAAFFSWIGAIID